MTVHEPKSKRSYRNGTCMHCGLMIHASIGQVGWDGWADFEGEGPGGRFECPTPEAPPAVEETNETAHLNTRHYNAGTAECGCPVRKMAGLLVTIHRDACQDGPVGVCGGCGHDVYADETDEHAECGQA